MLVKNIKKRGVCVVTSLGKVQFNDEGFAEVYEDIARRLACLKGYEIVAEQSIRVTIDEELYDSDNNKADDQPNDSKNNKPADRETDENTKDDEVPADGVMEIGKQSDGTQLQLPQGDNSEVGSIPTPLISIDKMTIEQLRQYAKENDIDIKGATKKPDILEIIKGCV